MNQEEQTERIIYLISKSVNGTIDASEQQELDGWKNSSPSNLLLYEKLLDSDYTKQQLQSWSKEDTEDELEWLHANMDIHLARKQNNYRIAVAAILVVLATISIYFFVLNREHQKQYTGDALYQVAQTITSNPDAATLTLDDGKVIDLANVQNGTIAHQNGITIRKNANGEIIYEPTSTVAANNTYNTIQTPKGGRYTLRLPDGTKVWLNAATNLRYPTDLSQSPKRVVEVSGEAYFEVAPNKAKPFVVITAEQTIEVLGTHFNVSSYSDDGNTVTTLVEGSVRASTAKEQKMLKPGQRAVNSANSIKIEPADTELATAWKDGRLQFKELPLKDMMRLVARWYNINVKYEGNVPNEAFTGNLPNGSSLTVLLKILAASNIHFELYEKDIQRTLIIKP